MKKELFLSLSVAALVGGFAAMYSGQAIGDDGPKADCLEMKCAYKCSENAQGKGKCCTKPTQQSCRQEKKDDYGCVIIEKIECPNTQPVCQENGTCAYCNSSADCPDLHTYCVNGACMPCNQAGTGVRPNIHSEQCECPEGYSKRCGTTKTAVSCTNGGNWTCVKGCFDNTDCPTDEYCSCSGNSCSAAGGKCLPCPEGTHRSETSATQCVTCAACQEWSSEAQECVSTCPPGQICLQLRGGNNGQQCNGDMCFAAPDRDQLVHVTGVFNNRDFYLPPTGDYYKLTHTSASRFCEHYGMHLATVTEACIKDYAYDTGHDCPNFVNNQTFTDRGRSYRLSSWHVDGMGSFWLANLSGNYGLRVTYSCGNNHSSHVCNGFYPLCTTN